MTMARRDLLTQLQAHVSNQLDATVAERRWVAGIIGDHPSAYAKSPGLWNAAFQALHLDAAYVPLDVAESQLPALVGALRAGDQVVGFNVTVPYKIAIMKLLNAVDPKAAQIGAVNTVARTPDGRLMGYNTDGQGGLDSLTRALPGLGPPLVEELTGRPALLLGSGGAGRAMAFSLAESLGPKGRLTIANRDAARAAELASAVSRVYGNSVAISEGEIREVLPGVHLVVNATTKGQSGLRRLPGGRVTCLEPYSALAPANPAAIDESQATDEASFHRVWYWASLGDIERNHRDSNWIMLTAGQGAAFFDLIYAPLETHLLAQARWTGHPTKNGKGMNIAQAVAGFVHRVMPRQLQSLGVDPQAAYPAVFQAMAKVW
jgi:shikimate dehydrogenase